MKKKVLSLILALAMLATSVCTVFAAGEVDVAVSGTSLTAMVNFFADNTPASKETRQELFGYIQMYMGGTDRDMETLINAVKNKSFTGLEDNAELKKVFEALMNDETIYPAALLTLEMIRAIPEAKRAEVIDGFGVKQDGARTKYAWKDNAADTAARDTALVALYNEDTVYPAKLRDAMEEHEAFAEADAPYIVLNLFTAWKDTFQFTDDGEGFKTYQVNDEYAKRLLTNMGDYYTLDGKEITSASQIADAVATAINGYAAAVKANMKTVLDDSGLDLYVPAGDIDTALSEVDVNGEKFTTISTDAAAPTEVTVEADKFTLAATAKATGAKVEYAVLDEGETVGDATEWKAALADEALANGESKTVAIRVTSKNGEETAVYYVAVSRPAVESDVKLDGIQKHGETELPIEPTAFDPQVTSYDAIIEDLSKTYAIAGNTSNDEATVSYVLGKVGDDPAKLTGYAAEIPEVTFEAASDAPVLYVIRVQTTDAETGAVLNTAYYSFNLYPNAGTILEATTEGFTLKGGFQPDKFNYGTDMLTSSNGSYSIKLSGMAAGATVTYGTTTLNASESTYEDVADTDYSESTGITGRLGYGESTKVVVKVANGESVTYYTFKLEREEEPEPDRPNRRPSSDDDDKSSNRRPSLVIPSTNQIPAPPAATVIFPDTAGHWAKDYVSNIAEKGLFIGHADGNFYPNLGVTRQEMAVVLVRLLGLEGELGSAPAAGYSDDAAIAAWAYDSVALLSQRGIYLGYDDGEFKPFRVLTREEMISLMMRLYGDTTIDMTIRYSDAEQVAEWARKAVGQGTNLDIINGHETGLFRPKDEVTRAEACKILYNYIYRKTNG